MTSTDLTRQRRDIDLVHQWRPSILVIRSRPIAGLETLHSYVQRLSSINGHRRICEVSTLARLPRDFAVRPCGLAGLGALVSVDEEDLVALACWPEACGRTARLGGHSVPLQCLNLGRARICPECLAEGALPRRVWNLQSYAACVRHRRAMVDACGSCGIDLRWDRSSFRSCGCEALLDSGRVEVPTAVLDLCRRMEQLHLGPALTGSGSSTLGGLLEAVRFFGADHHSPGRFRSDFAAKPKVPDAIVALERASDVLLDLQDGVARWLDACRNASAGHVGIDAVYGAPLTRLRAAMPHAHDVLEAVRQALGRAAVPPRSSSFFSTGIDDGRRLNGVAAARRLGVTVGRVSRLLASGKLEGGSHQAGRRRMHRPETASVESLRTRLITSLNGREVGDVLGTSAHQIEWFVRDGVLTPMPSSSTRRFDRSAVQALLDDLVGKAVTATGRAGMVSLAELPRQRSIRVSTVVSLVRLGTVVLERVGTEDVADLRGLYVSLAEVLAQKRGGGVEWLDVREGARRMRLNPRMLPVLVEAGMLRARRGPDGSIAKRGIAASAVEAFGRDFVTAGHLAPLLRTSTRGFASRLAAAGVRPVMASDTKAGVTAVWSREAVRRSGIMHGTGMAGPESSPTDAG